MAAGNRPLSPHLQVYRPQITSVLSILHRVSGAFLSLGIVVFTYWLTSLAAGPAAYAVATQRLGSWPGKLLLFCWLLAFSYHLLNGLRHLVWDMGKGFEIEQVERSGWAVLISSLLLAALLSVALFTTVSS